MRVKLIERREEAAEVMTFVFDLGGQDYAYRAGQNAEFTLDRLDYPDARGKERHFTFSSSPSEKGIVQFTTMLRGSGYKETLVHAPLGLEVELQNPADGKFILPEDESQPLVFIGGGIGITTFRSMMRYATDENLPTPITLLYSVKTPEAIIFRRELERLPQENPKVQIFVTVTEPENSREQWSGETGHIDAEKIFAHLDADATPLYYTSGPPGLVKSMVDLLKGIGIPDKEIRREEYSGY